MSMKSYVRVVGIFCLIFCSNSYDDDSFWPFSQKGGTVATHLHFVLTFLCIHVYQLVCGYNNIIYNIILILLLYHVRARTTTLVVYIMDKLYVGSVHTL